MENTFLNFQMSKLYSQDLSEHNNCFSGIGFVYHGNCVIEVTVSDDLEDASFSVMVGNEEFLTNDLSKAEEHLYENWAKFECFD